MFETIFNRLKEIKNINVIFWGIILCIVVMFYILTYSNLTSNYRPILPDETQYFGDSKYSYENTTITAAFTADGVGSKIKTGRHGFAYTILNALVAGVFGWHNLNFIYTNIAFIVVCLIIFFSLGFINTLQKIKISILFLVFPLIPVYSVTYMQEMVHVFFAILLSVILYKISLKNNPKLIFYFILICLIASLFRPLWLFFLIMLLPFSNSRKQFYYLSIIFVNGVILSFIFNIIFNAPGPYYLEVFLNFVSHHDYKGAILSFTNHFLENIYTLFAWGVMNTRFPYSLIYCSINYITLGVVIYFIYKSIKYKDKLSISFSIVSLIVYVLMFSLYYAFNWQDIRIVSDLFYMSILFLVFKGDKRIFNIILVYFLLIFIFSLKVSKLCIEERKYDNLSNLENQYNEIKRAVTDQKETWVLINYCPDKYADDLVFLPFRSDNNFPIHYMFPYLEPYFKVKIKVNPDYIMDRPSASIDSLKQKILINNEFYKLSKMK